MRVEFTQSQHVKGLQWRYVSDNGDELSIICHTGSYGGIDGKFETMCSWLNDVQGYLSFGQVQQKINTIYKREAKSRMQGNGE